MRVVFLCPERGFPAESKGRTISYRYTTELIAQLRSHNEDQYAQVIDDIHDLTWDTLEFVRLNALRLA